MAVAGQVSVKFQAETAEYTAGTDKVKRANKEVDDSAKRVGAGNPFKAIGGSIHEMNQQLKSSGIEPTLKLLMGGGAIALFAHGLNMAADAAQKYSKGIGDGLTKTEALLAMAYDIPITGAIVKLGDALDGTENPAEMIAKVKELKNQAFEAANAQMKEGDKRDALSFDVKLANPKFFDEYARQHQEATAAVREQIDLQKKLMLLSDEESESKIALEKQISDTHAAYNSELRQGHSIEADILKVVEGMLDRTLTMRVKNFEKQKQLIQLEKQNAANTAQMNFEDGLIKKIPGLLQGFVGNTAKFSEGLTGGISKFFGDWQAGVEKARTAEDAIKDSIVSRLEAAGALGNDEAALAAKRLKIEMQIAAERDKLQHIATDNKMPDQLRRAAEEEMRRLPAVQAAMEAQLQNTFEHPSLTPQLSAQFSTNSASSIPNQQLDQLKKANVALSKLAGASAPKVVSIGGN